MVCPLRSSPRYVLRCDARLVSLRTAGQVWSEKRRECSNVRTLPFTTFLSFGSPQKKRTWIHSRLFLYIEVDIMGFIFFLIGVAVVVVDFLLGDPIDWWMVILAFLCSSVSYVVFSDFYDDWPLTRPPLIFLHPVGMWAHYPTSRRKKMLTVLTKSSDSHTADHSQNATVCRYPPFFVGNALFLRNYAVALSVARVNPGGFSSTMSNYIFTSPRSKLSPLVFCPLGRGQGDTIEKQEKRILLS